MCTLHGVTLLQVDAMPMMLPKIFCLETDGIMHGAGGGAFVTVHKDTGKGADVDGFVREALIKSAFRKFNSVLTVEITFH